MIKISGKGFGSGGFLSKKGDLYVIPQVEIPKKLSKIKKNSGTNSNLKNKGF